MSQTSKEELLKFAKQRAMEYFNKGDRRNAVTSLMSDFNKWKIYDDNTCVNMLLLMAFTNPSVVDEKFIMGFN